MTETSWVIRDPKPRPIIVVHPTHWSEDLNRELESAGYFVIVSEYPSHFMVKTAEEPSPPLHALMVQAAALIYGNAIGKFAVSIADGAFSETEVLAASIDAAFRINTEVFCRLNPPAPALESLSKP